ncbi:hypothetical protein RYX36_026300 [Vicia faba]
MPLPMEGSPISFKTWVRGKEIDLYISVINEFLGNPCTLGDDELDEYHIQLAKGNWDFESLRNKLCKRGALMRQVDPAPGVVPIVVSLLAQSHFDPHDDYNMVMHEAYRRAFLFMQKSMQHLYLHIGNPLIRRPLGTKEELIAYANWPEGGPSAQEVAVEYEAGDVSSGDSIFDEDGGFSKLNYFSLATVKTSMNEKYLKTSSSIKWVEKISLSKKKRLKLVSWSCVEKSRDKYEEEEAKSAGAEYVLQVEPEVEGSKNGNHVEAQYYIIRSTGMMPPTITLNYNSWIVVETKLKGKKTRLKVSDCGKGKGIVYNETDLVGCSSRCDVNATSSTDNQKGIDEIQLCTLKLIQLFWPLCLHQCNWISLFR